jgi:hypothetical protein
MENLRVVRVVYVREDAQELAVDMFDCGGECLREVVACGGCAYFNDRMYVLFNL